MCRDGRIIAKQYPVEMSEFGTKTYRSQECLTLDHDYVLVERGPTIYPRRTSARPTRT